MVEKCGVVAAGAKRGDTKIGAGARVFAVLLTAHREPGSMATLPDGNILLRISNVTGDGVHKFFQRVRTFHAKKAAAVSVSIDVESGVLLEFVAVVLSPLRGAQQHRLFTVPRAIND